VTEIQAGKGLLDTSVLIDLDTASALPEQGSISTLSLADDSLLEVVDASRAA